MQNLILRLMEASSISDSIGNISKKLKNGQKWHNFGYRNNAGFHSVEVESYIQDDSNVVKIHNLYYVRY